MGGSDKIKTWEICNTDSMDQYFFYWVSLYFTRTTFWPLCSSQLLSLIFFTATFPSAKKNIGEKGIYSNIFLKSWQQHLQTYMSQYVDFMGRVADQHTILFRGRHTDRNIFEVSY